MKKLTYFFPAAAILIFAASCEQELVDNTASPCPSDDPSIICPEAPPPADCPDGASAGNADFSKFVAIGTSYTAGFQAGALFTEGQENSLPKILANQFDCVGGGAFNQPSINTEHGFNVFVTPNPVGNTVFGRFRLQGTPPAPAPVIAGPEAIPNIAVNPSFAYTGDKSALNNFAVPVILLGQISLAETGDWMNAGNSTFSPFYARFSQGSTILNDAVAAQPTFFMFWMGMDDYLLYAAYGGDEDQVPPPTPVDGAQGFRNLYHGAIATLLDSNPELKGVVANFPNPFFMPHFTAVPYNPIPMTEADAAAANAGFAGYNQILDALKGAPFDYPAADIDDRKIVFAAGANPFVIEDETLKDFGDEFDMLLGEQMITPEQRAQLAPYEQVRMTTSNDIIPLSAGSVLGTLADENNPASVMGVGVPMPDRYVLIPSEIEAIETARAGYNTVVSEVVNANPTHVAFADINTLMNTFVANQGAVDHGVLVVPLINPPVGIYSEDGMHPNARGYAFIANAFIDAINANFEASVPKIRLGRYLPTGFPINP